MKPEAKKNVFSAVQRVRAHDLSRMISTCNAPVSTVSPRLAAFAKKNAARPLKRSASQ